METEINSGSKERLKESIKLQESIKQEKLSPALVPNGTNYGAIVVSARQKEEQISSNHSGVLKAAPAATRKDDWRAIEQSVRYAGFWIRAAATIVDEINLTILCFFGAGILLASGAYGSGLLDVLAKDWPVKLPVCFHLNPVGIAVMVVVTFILCLVIPWFYVGAYESSHLRATPGKYLFGLAVVDEHGKTISFWRSIYKLFVQTVMCVCLSLTWVGLGMLCSWALPSYNLLVLLIVQGGPI